MTLCLGSMHHTVGRSSLHREGKRSLASGQVTTFHAFCLDALQHCGEHVGLKPPLTVFESAEDQKATLAQALAQDLEAEGVRASADTVAGLRREIGRLKRQLIPPDAVPAEDAVDGASVGAAYEAYDRRLQTFGALDFDDLLRYGASLFQSSERVARHYRRIYRYILVDEGQDTSRAQYEVLKAFCGDEHRNVMLVADEDQSIYRFTGASPEYLKAFLRDVDATEHRLSENFRCAEAIVTVANALIAAGTQRPETMTSMTLAPGFVSAASYEDEEAEARGTADLLEGLLRDGLAREWLYADEDASLHPEDLCVLARSRYPLDAVDKELRGRGHAVAVRSTQQGLFESTTYRFAYGALRVAHNPRDFPARASLQAQVGLSEEDLPALELLARIEATVDHRRRAAARQMGLWLRDGAPVDRLIPNLIDALEEGPEEEEAEREARLKDREALRSRWGTYLRTTSAPSLAGFLGELALASRAAIEEPGIRLLTVHAAKGLEFRAVVIVGMNEGTFPDYRCLSGADLEEERRNAYVAVTRAERRLHLTRSRQRQMPWGDTRTQHASRFLAWMGVLVAVREG